MDQLLSTGEGNLDTSNIPAFVQTSNKEEALNRLDSEVVNLNHILEILNQLPNWADKYDHSETKHASEVADCLHFYGDVICTSRLLNNDVEVSELKHLLGVTTATRRTLEVTVRILRL